MLISYNSKYETLNVQCISFLTLYIMRMQRYCDNIHVHQCTKVACCVKCKVIYHIFSYIAVPIYSNGKPFKSCKNISYILQHTYFFLIMIFGHQDKWNGCHGSISKSRKRCHNVDKDYISNTYHPKHCTAE